MELLLSGTAAGVSDTFSLSSHQGKSPSLFATGLIMGEQVKLQFTPDNTNWFDLYYAGTLVALEYNNNVIPLNIVGRYRLSKGVTSVDVKCYIASEFAV